MKVSICGLGYIGLPLAKSLATLGHEVHGTTRSKEKLKNFPLSEILLSPDSPSANITKCDVLVLNIPPFEHQLEWFKTWDLTHVEKIIFISSTSVLHSNGRSGDVLKSEEDWVRSCGLPWVVIRPGGLLGHGRHPGKYLAGKTGLKGGQSPVNLIHADDVVGFILTVIEKNLVSEDFDLVSDEHHTREEFYSDYCRRMDLPMPVFSPEEDTGFIVSNEKIKIHYQLKFPTMLGKSL